MKQSCMLLLLLFALGAIASTQETEPAPPAGQQSQPSQNRQPRPEWRGRMGMNGVAGQITAIQGNTLTLKTQDGKEAKVTVDEQTRIMRDRQPAKLSDFKVGDDIMVRGEPAGEGAWKALALFNADAMMMAMRENLGKSFIAGEVKSIEDTKLTIERVDGKTQVIEVDENTSFFRRRENITLPDIKPGDQVFGQGELKDGIFVAKTLRVGNFNRMRGMAPPPNGASGDAPKQ